MIGEFWSSKIVPSCLFPHHKALGRQSIEVLLQSVVAKANFAEESSEVFGFAVLEGG
jgi:hypothetical protein